MKEINKENLNSIEQEYLNDQCSTITRRVLVKNNISILTKKNEEIDYTYDYEYVLNDFLDGKVYVYVNNSTIEGEIYTDSIIKKRNSFEIMSYLISNHI